MEAGKAEVLSEGEGLVIWAYGALVNQALAAQERLAQRGLQVVQRDLQFDIRRGEVLAIVGPSGCGKTTLLRHLVGLQAPLLIGGAVIIEQIFVIPGMGLLLLDAVNQRDYPIITGVFLIVGVAVMLINLVVDLSYGLLDPKVRYR